MEKRRRKVEEVSIDEVRLARWPLDYHIDCKLRCHHQRNHSIETPEPVEATKP